MAGGIELDTFDTQEPIFDRPVHDPVDALGLLRVISP